MCTTPPPVGTCVRDEEILTLILHFPLSFLPLDLETPLTFPVVIRKFYKHTLFICVLRPPSTSKDLINTNDPLLYVFVVNVILLCQIT